MFAGTSERSSRHLTRTFQHDREDAKVSQSADLCGLMRRYEQQKRGIKSEADFDATPQTVGQLRAGMRRRLTTHLFQSQAQKRGLQEVERDYSGLSRHLDASDAEVRSPWRHVLLVYQVLFAFTIVLADGKPKISKTAIP
jgi:hypothetical protein